MKACVKAAQFVAGPRRHVDGGAPTVKPPACFSGLERQAAKG
jgi:hypothetical protein